MLKSILPLASFKRATERYRHACRHHAIVKKYGLTHYHTDDWVRSDARARDLLRRAESAVSWAPQPLYPTGGAGGALLLYILLRALSELPFQRVLELGAGQSTRLFDAWVQATGGSVLTLEQDEYWASHIREQLGSVRSHVLHAPLVKVPAPGGEVSWYSPPPPEFLPEAGFDLVLIDGPVGAKRLSRYGIVEHLPAWLGTEWLLVWDDLDRAPDLASFALLIEKLKQAGVAHDHLLFDGDRTIGIVYTPSFRAARYLW